MYIFIYLSVRLLINFAILGTFQIIALIDLAIEKQIWIFAISR